MVIVHPEHTVGIVVRLYALYVKKEHSLLLAALLTARLVYKECTQLFLGVLLVHFVLRTHLLTSCMVHP